MADTRGPDHRPGTSQGMPGWSWAAIAAAVIVVLALVFMWSDGSQQTADTPTNPGTGTTSTQSPAKTPASPTPGTTKPPAKQ